MYRAIAVVSVIVGLGIMSLAAPMPKEPPSPDAKLMQRVNYEGIDDARATLSDAFDRLNKLYGLTFDVNEKAFMIDGVQEVGKTEVGNPPIPEMKNVQINHILRRILRRIPAVTGATFTVRSDHIEITTNAFQRLEIWGKYGGPYLPLVNATLDQVPLDDAARQLADQAGFNVIVDQRAGQNAKTPVSARLRNTPLDTALRLLSDSADLQTVQIDNVLYITSMVNATALEAKLEKEKATDNKNNPDTPNAGERKGSGPQELVPPPPQGGA